MLACASETEPGMLSARRITMLLNGALMVPQWRPRRLRSGLDAEVADKGLHDSALGAPSGTLEVADLQAF